MGKTTSSPVNTANIESQNQALLGWLKQGNVIHLFHPAKRFLQIGHLPSRVSDIHNRMKIPVKRRWITVTRSRKKHRIVEYSMPQEQ